MTETALTTALNTSYMAERLSVFGIVVGVALLLTGVGLGILALGGASAEPESGEEAAKQLGSATKVATATDAVRPPGASREGRPPGRPSPCSACY